MEGFVMPDFVENLRQQNAKMNAMTQKLNENIERAQYSRSVKFIRELILEAVKSIERDLDSSHEIAVRLASFGKSVQMNVESIGCVEPSLLYFHGSVDGQRATLIQNVNQLSFLIVVVTVDAPRPPIRIGFHMDPEEQSQAPK